MTGPGVDEEDGAWPGSTYPVPPPTLADEIGSILRHRHGAHDTMTIAVTFGLLQRIFDVLNAAEKRNG
jgi:hypothetical protein